MPSHAAWRQIGRSELEGYTISLGSHSQHRSFGQDPLALEIVIDPDDDLRAVRSYGNNFNGLTFDITPYKQNITAINPINQRIVNQETMRLAIEQAYNAVFSEFEEATADGTAERAMLDQQSYKFGQNELYVDTRSILSQAQTAHADGYTGEGLDLTVHVATLAEVGRIAPDATRGFHMMDAATVAKSSDTITFDDGDRRLNAQNAAGTALVWDKFDTASGSSIETHVDNNMTNGLINITGALAPVGPLN